MTKQEATQFDEIKEQLEKAQADIQTLVTECNARGELINNQAQQLREKDAKITELYEKYCEALNQAMSNLNAFYEYKGKAEAYEQRIAVLESQNEELTKIIGGNEQ